MLRLMGMLSLSVVYGDCECNLLCLLCLYLLLVPAANLQREDKLKMKAVSLEK